MGEIYEAFAFNYKWTRKYIQNQLTRPQVKMYWYYMQQRITKDLERQAMQWGYDPKKAREQRGQKEMSEKWKDDPLYNFPNDIDYLNAKQVAEKIEVTMQFKEKLAVEKRWDRDRGTACLGRQGSAAKRCSMNDKLWSLWLKAKHKGRTLSLEQIKSMIRFDIARSKLYPPNWADDTKDPPQWYTDKLKAEGKFETILKEIEEASK